LDAEWPILEAGMDKRTLSERDICTKFIAPALRQAGWDEMLQIREEVSFTKGRIKKGGATCRWDLHRRQGTRPHHGTTRRPVAAHGNAEEYGHGDIPDSGDLATPHKKRLGVRK
jgi:hypothetical protein